MIDEMALRFDEMGLFMDSGCDICRTPSTIDRPCVDHRHRTGKIRSLLRTRCDSGPGFFRDEIGFLRAAIRYLERHSDDD